MRNKSIILLILQLLMAHFSFSQRIWGQDDFCKKKNGQKLIGETVKIWSNGGIYTSINTSNLLEWPTKELKDKAGKSSWGNFYPQAGDTGKIVHVFAFDKERVASANLIYLVDIKGNFVPIGCGYLTTTDRMDENEESAYWRLQDSLKNVKYANGCNFKTSNINGSYFEAGKHEIDKVAETFACELSTKNLDTVLLIKSFNNNHGLGISKFEGILWSEKGKGYLKLFEDVKNKIIEKSTRPIDFKEIQNYFFNNSLISDTTNPQPLMWINHDLTFYIQFKIRNQFYAESLTNSELTGDTKHRKSIWWSMILNELKKNP